MAYDLAEWGGEHAATLTENLRRVDRAAAAGLRPPPRMTVAEWAATHRRFPDDDAYPGRWRHETAPYLVEIMEGLSPHDPCEEVDVGKCAQSGGSASGENWLGFISDLAPGPVLFVQATFKAALDWAGEKFWPMVDASPRLGSRRDGTIRPQGAADGNGSTKFKVRFRRSNGYILLAGANSAPSLRQRTVRYAIEDDLDQFPDDLDGQGSPETMIDNRLKVYRRQGLSKRLAISTFTVKGSSKIGRRLADSDLRRYYLKCPHCAARFDPIWTDVAWPDGKPEQAYLVPPCCGSPVEHWQKAAMSLADGWLSVVVDERRSPRHLDEAEFQAVRANMPRSAKRGFHISGLVTAFQTWADVAVRFVAAQGDLNKLRAWTNLDLGEEFEIKGATPDYEKLQELKEQGWGRGQVPVGAVCTTLGVDVQGDGLYVELLGHGEHAETWSVDVRFIPGATDVPGVGAWVDLDAYARQRIVYPGGRSYPIDQACIDAGYHTAATEAFCRGHANRLPVFGRAGWTLPVLGRGENLRYDRQGRKIGQASKRAEDKAFLVGTYGVKLSFYGYLRATLKAAADEASGVAAGVVRGRCHFNRDAPDDWFQQVTSEHIIAVRVGASKAKASQPERLGFTKRVWEPLPGRPNHWLDCRVYNYAGAEKLMLDTLTPADWSRLRAERYGAADPAQGDLLAQLARPAIAPAAEVAPAAQTTETPATRAWIDGGEDWLT